MYNIGLINSVFAHSIGGISLQTDLRVDFVQFSDQTTDVNRGVKIMGNLKNLAGRELTLSPNIAIDSSSPGPLGQDDIGSSAPIKLVKSIYPLYQEQATWYFTIKSNLSTPFVIKPDEEINFEITAFPLKAGTYHLHPLFTSENLDTLYAGYIGSGKTIVVNGPTSITTGEFTQFYLPIIFGSATASILIVNAFRNRTYTRKFGVTEKFSVTNHALKSYFAIKAAFEITWLSGLIFWFMLAAYVLQPLELRYLMVLNTMIILGIITIGSILASAIAGSKNVQKLVAIGTSVLSAGFYLALFMPSGIAQIEPQFNIASWISLSAVIANAAVIVLIMIMWYMQKHEPRFADRLSSE